jgi:hypothetical protein
LNTAPLAYECLHLLQTKTWKVVEGRRTLAVKPKRSDRTWRSRAYKDNRTRVSALLTLASKEPPSFSPKMVAQFAPRSNVPDDPCQGVKLYELGRSPMSQDLKNLNLAFFIILAVLQLIVIIVTWQLREKPRFRKVRPFELSFSLTTCFFLYQIAAMLSYVVALPCALVVVLYVVSLSWFGAVGSIRALVLALESNYAKQAQKEALKQDDQQSQAAVSISQASTHMTLTSVATRVQLLLQVITGRVMVDQLHITELVVVKNSVVGLMLVYAMPAFLTGILLVALTPPYQTCYGCDIFLELPIGIAVCLLLYLVSALFMSYQAYRAVGLDEKGVVAEMLFIGGFVAPLALVIWILMIVDPGGVQYLNTFNWSLLFAVTSSLWLASGYFYQFYIHLRYDWSSGLNIETMDTMFASDPSIKTEFLEFAARHFVMESLNFVEDVKMYKSLYYEKAESWRLSKFKYLIETYIASGSRMEVNISHTMKLEILRAYDQAKHGKVNKDLFVVLDEALKEVEQMIHNGAWTEYLFKRKRKQALSVAVHNA